MLVGSCARSYADVSGCARVEEFISGFIENR